MSCCGQKREQLKTSSQYHTLPQPATAPSFVRLRYLATARIRVFGGATGRLYEFSAAAATQSVDARDAEALLRGKLFRREA